MDVNLRALQGVSANFALPRSAPVANGAPVAKTTVDEPKVLAAKEADSMPASGGESKQLSREELQVVTAAMTKFMESLNTNIQFSMYQKTGQLIVQVMDSKSGQVLKEFPPHQLLDTLAAIRDYVGALLDKKA